MIVLTKLNGIEFTLNCDLIETIEENPDTTIRLTSGKIYIVKENMRDVITKTLDYRRQVFRDILGGKN